MSRSSAATRLALLEGYLEEDASNEALRVAAFEAAHEAGRPDSATLLAEGALARGHATSDWLHRLASVRLVQGELAAAHTLLLQAREAGAPAAVVDHDLAWLACTQGEAQRCLDLLRPHVSADSGSLEPGVLCALQLLWLRTLHRLRQFDVACTWSIEHAAAGRLQPAACGVAALLAWDAGQLEMAERWAETALLADTECLEGLITLAGLALMRRQHPVAESRVRQALDLRPGEGRTWFVAGLASLQLGDARQAEERFARATALMTGHIGSWHGLGWARLLAAGPAAARVAFERALALDPAFGESHGAMGLVHALAADAGGAEPHLRVALKLDPASVTARYARAVLAGEAGVERLQALAARLLDRPGFFGATLAADALVGAPAGPLSPAPT